MNLENNGERMDINYYNMDYNSFDIYQKSHYKRYEMAKKMVKPDFIVADMACGSGYGSMMLSEICKEVHGVDIDETTINEIKKRYSGETKVIFYNMNLIDINFEKKFDMIISFETVEHFEEFEIDKLFFNFHRSLKDGGQFLFSTPYNQDKNIHSMKWHRTFYITEEKIQSLIKKYFVIEKIWYQDYVTHNLNEEGIVKHFIICKTKKI